MDYNFTAIEAKWQKYWLEHKVFAAQTGSEKPKFYGLIEFPYPSGHGLHVGHARPYTAMDVVARKRELPIYCVARDDGRIAISFDASWGGDKTLRLLDILDEYQVTTTFFMVNIWVDKYPELVKEIVHWRSVPVVFSATVNECLWECGLLDCVSTGRSVIQSDRPPTDIPAH